MVGNEVALRAVTEADLDLAKDGCVNVLVVTSNAPDVEDYGDRDSPGP